VLKSGKHDTGFYKSLWDTILSGEVFHAKLTNKRKNGELYVEDTVITPVKDGNGEISNFIAIKRDITEQMRLDDELQRSEERYRTMLEGIGEGYFEVDLSGRLTMFNDAMCNISGYSREDLLGKGYREYVSSVTAVTLYGLFNRVFLTGEPEICSNWEIITKDGKSRLLEASVQLMRDNDGKPDGFRGLVRQKASGSQNMSTKQEQ
jgi:PAS domain S-box-containing protein